MFSALNQVTAGRGLALPEYIALAARHGFKGVDFSISEAARYAAEHDLAATKALFAEPGVRPASFGLPVAWRKEEDVFARDLDALAPLVELARELGCDRCSAAVVPDSGEPVQEYAARSSRRLIAAAQVLQKSGVRLGLEFLGPKHFRKNPDNVWFYDIPGALRVIDDMAQAGGLTNLGLLIDAWHWYTSGGTLADIAAMPVEQIVHVHINDAPNIPRDEQIDSVRLLPGASGVIDITGFLQTLQSRGYDGPVAVETFSEELRALSPDEAAKRAAAAVKSVFAAAGLQG